MQAYNHEDTLALLTSEASEEELRAVKEACSLRLTALAAARVSVQKEQKKEAGANRSERSLAATEKREAHARDVLIRKAFRPIMKTRAQLNSELTSFAIAGTHFRTKAVKELIKKRAADDKDAAKAVRAEKKREREEAKAATAARTAAANGQKNATFQDFQRLIKAQDAITKDVQQERILSLAPELPAEVLKGADLALFARTPCALHQGKLNSMLYKVDAELFAAGDAEEYVQEVLDGQ